MDYSQPIISRFAPTPTGIFQLGIIRNALYIYLLTKKTNGKFILRIDDTDPRCQKKYEEYMIESLKWLGLEPDEIYRQSERKNIYKRYIEKLINNGNAYISKENNKTLIRFKNEGGKLDYFDQLRGKINSDVSYFGDFIIARNLDDPTYHLASIVDDYEMGINYVLRGEDHIPNTPKHLMIANALNIKTPLYCHLPLLLGPDGSKLSLRKEQGMSILDFKELGYLPDAILNFVALSGWSSKKDRKPIFSKKELLGQFNIEGLQKTNSIFDISKLDWFNKQHLKRISLAEKIEKARFFIPKEYQTYNNLLLERFLVFIVERINKFSDITEMIADKKVEYFFKRPENLQDKEINPANIKDIISLLSEIQNIDFKIISIQNQLQKIKKKDTVIHPLEQMRRILSGQQISFDPINIASIIGKDETIYRLHNFIK